MANKRNIVNIILLLILAFWAGTIYVGDNINKDTIEISLEEYNFNGVENGKATFTRIDSAQQDNSIGPATVGNLSSKALLISDLPNRRIEYSEEGSMKYLVLNNGRVISGYHDIRDENGLIVCQIGSMNYLLDKSGNKLPIIPKKWVEEERAYFDQIINEIKNDKDQIEEQKKEGIAMLERDRDFPLGYQEIVFQDNKVYGRLGSQTAYIGDL